jgi:hypothetical protein
MRSGTVVSMFACIAIAGIGFATGGEGKADGEAAILKDDLRNLQGRWELVLKVQGRTVRSVQGIDGNKSTVTRYDEKGGVLEAHTADFTLSISGRTRIFTYFNYEITAGPAKVWSRPATVFCLPRTRRLVFRGMGIARGPGRTRRPEPLEASERACGGRSPEGAKFGLRPTVIPPLQGFRSRDRH